MRLRTVLLGAVLLVGFSGCSLLPAGDDGTRLTGQIEKIEVDCPTWGLQTNDELYELLNLPDEYKEDGLYVRMQIRHRNDLGNCTMVGPIIEVLHLERLN